MAEPIFVQEFKTKEDIIREYNAPVDSLKRATIYLAWYGYGNYCGDSLVIFKKDGKLFEVNASHCSCFGLEGQWKPEETSWKALAMRSPDNSCSGGEEARVILQKLASKHV